MPLKYSLHKNPLTNKNTTYRAIIQHVESRGQEELIELMVSRGSTITKAEALSVLEEYSQAIMQTLLEGKSINTPLLNFKLSIKGNFNGVQANFNAKEHQVQVNVSAGKLLKQITQEVAVERHIATSYSPIVMGFEDIGTQFRNDVVTPGGLGIITGKYLKFDQTDAEQGVFFEDGEGNPFRVAMVARNYPSELNFLIPSELRSGNYALIVKTVANDSGQYLKGVLPFGLVVR